MLAPQILSQPLPTILPLPKGMSPYEVLCRLSVLEGYAGVVPGMWSRKPAPHGWALAQRALGDEVPGWFANAKTIVYDAVCKGVASVPGANRETREDVVQEILGGLTLSTPGGELYAVGKLLSDSDKSGMNTAAHHLYRHARQRALSAVRPRLDVTPDPPPAPTDYMESLDYAVWTCGPQVWDAARKYLKVAWARCPSKMVIFEQIMKDVSKSDVQVARDLGHGENDPVSWVNFGMAAYVSKTRREIRDVMPAVVRKYPWALDRV